MKRRTQNPDLYKSAHTPQVSIEEKNTNFETIHAGSHTYSHTNSDDMNRRFDRQEKHIIFGFTGLCLLKITFKLIYILG